jgi:hypothetical protein
MAKMMTRYYKNRRKFRELGKILKIGVEIFLLLSVRDLKKKFVGQFFVLLLKW